MSRDYFRMGGPFHARPEGQSRISWSVPISEDDHGRIARCCPDDECSPGYFAVRMGTGITEAQTVAYCPYCRHESEPSSFWSKEQVRYLQEVALHETAVAFQNMLKDAFRGGGDTVIFEPGRIDHPRRPFEEDIRRDVVCPHCGLDHAVFGLAVWCPDCGKDILMTHVEAEYDIVRVTLGDVDRRRETYGARVAVRDLENCLEDVVSVFEAVLKAFLVRHLRQKGETEESILNLLSDRIRNGFQNVGRATEIVNDRMGADLFEGVDTKAVAQLKNVFEKRHPITHNLGIVDRKYLERAMQKEREGRDVRVTKEEILAAVQLCTSVLGNLHARVFGQGT